MMIGAEGTLSVSGIFAEGIFADGIFAEGIFAEKYEISQVNFRICAAYFIVK